MLTKIDSSKHKYRAICDVLRKGIQKGDFQPGTMLPAEVALAERYSVSRLTARRAVEELNKEGLVERYPGKGTVVQDVSSLKGAHSNTGQFLFLFVDEYDYQCDYYFAERLAAESYLAKRNRGLCVATLKSADAACGHFPPPLARGQVDGILLDGIVHDYHYEILKQFNLPCLAVGNHRLNGAIPQVRIDVEGMSDQIARSAAKLLDMPIWLVIDNFQIQTTVEMYAGYEKACAAVKQSPMIHINSSGDGEGVLKSLLAGTKGNFTIFTSDKPARGILDDYEKYGLNCRDNPVIVLGNSTTLSRKHMDQAVVFPVEKIPLSIRAAEILMNMTSDDTKEIYEELTMNLDNIEECLKSGGKVQTQ